MRRKECSYENEPVSAGREKQFQAACWSGTVEERYWGLECPWYFVRGDMIWSKTEGWKEFYEGNREHRYFKSLEEAMKAWESSGQ
jgi:hypothetical protein